MVKFIKEAIMKLCKLTIILIFSMIIIILLAIGNNKLRIASNEVTKKPSEAIRHENYIFSNLATLSGELDQDNLLTIKIESLIGDSIIYNTDLTLQVKMEHKWQSIHSELNIPLPLSTIDMSSTRFKLDLSSLNLEDGAYRLIINYIRPRLCETGYMAAYFTLGDYGSPDRDDISISLASAYIARKEVCDNDSTVFLTIDDNENTQYHIKQLILEDIGHNQSYQLDLASFVNNHENNYIISLKEPLQSGDYNLDIEVVSNGDKITKLSHSFVVYNESTTPLKFDTNDLELSSYDYHNSNGMIELNQEREIEADGILSVVITSQERYNYSEYYDLEVKLNEAWYSIPVNHSMINDILYSVGNKSGSNSSIFSVNLFDRFGALPKGDYRIVIPFQYVNSAADRLEVLSKSYAILDFVLKTDTLIS